MRICFYFIILRDFKNLFGICFADFNLSIMKVAILFPNTESSRLVSTRLLENGYEVFFFCPDKLDIEIAQNYIFELNIIGREQDMQRQRENSFSVEKNDLSDCEVLGEFTWFLV